MMHQYSHIVPQSIPKTKVPNFHHLPKKFVDSIARTHKKTWVQISPSA